jgi:hypothetical protein
MKYVVALICLFLATIAAPSYAHEMTNDCAAKAAKIANTEERAKTEKDCLAKVASPENVAKHEQHDKEEHCATNAKNMKLAGKDKADYLTHCNSENDFAPNPNTPHPAAAK